MRVKPDPLTLSGRFYSLLLYAYPAPFRREYGQPMAQLFRDEARDTLQGSGPAGLIGLWFLTFYDLMKSALAEHIWEVFHMPMEKMMRFSAPAAMLSGVLWALLWILEYIELASSAAFVAVFLAMVLVSAFALIGASAGMPNRTPAVVALLVAMAGLGLFGVLGLFVISTDSAGDTVWSLFIIGFWLLMIGYAAMGIVALNAGVSRIIGISLLAMALFNAGIWLTGSEYGQFQVAMAIGHGISWVALGFGLRAAGLDRPDTMLPA